MPSPHYGVSRGPYNKAAFHTTEGAQTIESLGNWFANPAAKCSSHHGADNMKKGTFGAYVFENYSAWTQGNANPYCLSIELCTPSGAASSWNRSYWLNQQNTLVRNAAEWCAYVCGKYGIPLKALSNSEAQNPNVRGVCQHVNFGSWGSGHHDCGNGFPIDQVLLWAQEGQPPDLQGSEMTPAVCYWQEKPYLACVGEDKKVWFKAPDGGWAVVDKNASVKSGLSIAASNNGKLIIAYTNQGKKVCTYEKDRGGSQWVWVDQGGFGL